MHIHTPESLIEALGQLNLPHTVHHHAAVFTVADGEGMFDHMPGAHIKNLFLKDKAQNLYLVTALQERSLDLKALGKHLGAKDRLSFASEDTLMQTLGITPGSVSPLALINAQPGSVRVILDSAIFETDTVYPHPLINTQTVAMAPSDMLKATTHWGHAVEKLDLGQFKRA